MARLVRILLPLLALAALAIALQKWTKPAALALSGRARGCSFLQAVRSASEDERQLAIKDRLVQYSRKVQQDPAGFSLWQTPSGTYWIPTPSDFTLHWDLAEQERKIYGVGDRGVRPGDVVLDCGANIGVFTRVALAAGAKLVVAIEPSPENLECLRRNMKSETDAGKVIIYPKGVWDKDEELVMKVDPTNSAANTFVIQRQGLVDSIRLPLTTIDKLVEELKLERVDFIKMDIEGAEPRALRGAHNTIARFHPRMAISVYHTPTDFETVPAAIFSAWSGYRQECGPCSLRDNRIFPTVYYYYAH